MMKSYVTADGPQDCPRCDADSQKSMFLIRTPDGKELVCTQCLYEVVKSLPSGTVAILQISEWTVPFVPVPKDIVRGG
jgi:hypothetical protein